MCFDLFDTKKQDFLSADDLGEIMRAMGFRPTEEELKVRKTLLKTESGFSTLNFEGPAP